MAVAENMVPQTAPWWMETKAKIRPTPAVCIFDPWPNGRTTVGEGWHGRVARHGGVRPMAPRIRKKRKTEAVAAVFVHVFFFCRGRGLCIFCWGRGVCIFLGRGKLIRCLFGWFLGV